MFSQHTKNDQNTSNKETNGKRVKLVGAVICFTGTHQIISVLFR